MVISVDVLMSTLIKYSNKHENYQSIINYGYYVGRVYRSARTNTFAAAATASAAPAGA